VTKDVVVGRFENAAGRVSLHSLGRTRMLVVLEGNDTGAFGREPFAELEARLAEQGSLELFFDLRSAQTASLDASASWAVWLRQNAARLARVAFLPGPPAIALSARAVQRFAALGERAHVYADATEFERDLRSEGATP
jgi:hypothetical protein